MNNKLIRHSVGDRVVALSSSIAGRKQQPRSKGVVYTVKAVIYCSVCGIQAVNIADACRRLGSKARCGCGNRIDNHGMHYTWSNHFAKLDDIPAIIEEALESEDYELAALLRDAGKEVVGV